MGKPGNATSVQHGAFTQCQCWRTEAMQIRGVCWITGEKTVRLFSLNCVFCSGFRVFPYSVKLLLLYYLVWSTNKLQLFFCMHFHYWSCINFIYCWWASSCVSCSSLNYLIVYSINSTSKLRVNSRCKMCTSLGEWRNEKVHLLIKHFSKLPRPQKCQ